MLSATSLFDVKSLMKYADQLRAVVKTDYGSETKLTTETENLEDIPLG